MLAVTLDTDINNAFHWPVRVYYEDTDCGGVVYHTGYLRFMERARTEWLRALGYSQSRLRDELGVLFVVRRLTGDYMRPAELDDQLDVVTTAARQGRTRLHFAQDIHRLPSARETLFRGRVEIVCLSPATLRPRPLPVELPLESLDVVRS